MITTLIVLAAAYVVPTAISFLGAINFELFEDNHSIFLKIRRSIGLILFGWFIVWAAVLGAIVYGCVGIIGTIFDLQDD